MKNFEVTHTLRFYDPEWVAKLGALMERVQKHYRNKNEFMTVLVKMGYESYIAADQKAQSRNNGKAAAEPVAAADDSTDSETLKDLQNLLDELSLYVTTQFRQIQVNLSLLRRMLSSVYSMALSLSGGKAVPPEKVEDGFFDDLPARFEKIIVRLEQQYGLKT